jgi:hypothetical protein
MACVLCMLGNTCYTYIYTHTITPHTHTHTHTHTLRMCNTLCFSTAKNCFANALLGYAILYMYCTMPVLLTVITPRTGFLRDCFF